MESMEPIVCSPRVVDSGRVKIHDCRYSMPDASSHRGQQVITTEVVHWPHVVLESSGTRTRMRRKNPRFEIISSTEQQEIGLYNGALTSMDDFNFGRFYVDNTRDSAMEDEYNSGVDRVLDLDSHELGDVTNWEPRSRHSSSAQATPRRQLHIGHRKCGKRECDVCKPKMKNYHDLGVAIDPVLFSRWEVSGTAKEWRTIKNVKYKINGLGQVIKTVNKSAKGKVKESSEVIKRKVRVKLDTLKGQKVVARLDSDGLYYPASVQKCSDPRHARVKYDNGNEADVLTRNIIPTGGAVARPRLMIGDYVLMRVVNLDSNDECYVPAIIQMGPQKQEAQARFFSVIMYNGQKASTLRTYLLKISKERFELASMYIAEQQNENRKEAQDLVYVTPRDKKNRPATANVNKSRPQMRERQSKENSDRGSVKGDTKQYGSKESLSKQRISSVKKSRDRRSRKGKTRPENRKEEVEMRKYSDGSDSDVKEEIVYQSDSEASKENLLFEKRLKEEDAEDRTENQAHSDRGVFSDDEVGRMNTKGSDNDSEDERQSSRRDSASEEEQEDISSKEALDSRRSEGSISSKRKELQKLQRELEEREERQERQKRKLKKKAKKLARLETDLKGSGLYDVVEQEETIGVPVEDDATGGMEEDSNLYKLLELRKSLEHIRPGEEVLARWSDDGWYYRGMVKHYHGDYSYNLEDSTGFVERIWREDIISENDNVHKVIELDSKVVALHPEFSFSYAPACVSHVDDAEITVTFYDGQEAMLPWNEVYYSTEEKYTIDVSYIVKQERRLIGASVVARDDRTGVYYPGCVMRRADDGIDYVVGWTDGSECVQQSIHIFSAFTRRPLLTSGDRVLALADPVHVRFLPGYITGSGAKGVVVKFCDGEICDNVDPLFCYWLGQRFYEDAVKYHKTHDPSFY